MPERIGAYRLESPLGRGGMGEVFLAWDERLERAVAIKRIRHDAFVEGQQRERFRREARMAARLSHASIVQVHDLVSEESGDAIVMEYVEGPTLSERLARGPLGVMEAIHLAKEIAEGLAAAHEAGLIHRDLKAENVVITPSGHAKILDFGLARPVCWDGETLTQHGALVGTCYAMSPEQASGGDLDERSDLFSLGALLYEMLTGHSAFRAKDPRATLQRVLYEQPTPLAEIQPDLPPALVSLVERLLAKDRDARPKNALSVIHKLERIEHELPPEERPERRDDSVSEMPTQAFPVLPGSRSGSAATSRPAPSGPAVGEGPLRRARGWILFLAGALVALIIAVATLYMTDHRITNKPPPLRVLVMRPKLLDPTDEQLNTVAFGLMTWILRSLENRQGITPLDPSIIQGPPGPVQEVANNTAADDVLISEIKADQGMARISLRLVAGKDGHSLWSDTLSIRADSGNLLLLGDLVEGRLRNAFPNYPVRHDAPKIDAPSSDIAEFLAIQQRIESGSTRREEELENLERLIRKAPRFLEARIQATRTWCALFRSTRNPADLEHAQKQLDGARALAPSDPRTLRAEFLVALEGEQLYEAKVILERIESDSPGDPEVFFLHYRLASRQENWDEAERFLRIAIDLAPSWRSLYWLVDLQTRRGRVTEARRIIEDLLRQNPGNVWVQEQLAYLELLYGNLDRAEQIFQDLIRVNPQRSYLTNLGQALWLQGHFREARDAYEKALDMEPGHATPMINLADAKRVLGDADGAKVLYGVVLRLIDSEVGTNLSPRSEVMKAQCLVHLGRVEEAREALQRALQPGLEDPQIYKDVSLVYTVSGDLEQALDYAGRALSRGLPRRWFNIPDFEPLRREAGFKALIQASTPAPNLDGSIKAPTHP